MTNFFVFIVLVVLAFSQIPDTKGAKYTDCSNADVGYYCANNSTIYWCYGFKNYKEIQCATGLVCKCGYYPYSPCMWPYQETDDTCVGNPGDYFDTSTNPDESESSSEQQESSSEQQESSSEQQESSSEQQSSESSEFYWPDVEDGVYSMTPNTHLPLVLKLDKTNWKEQLEEITSHENYRNANLYEATQSNYECSLHPPSKYDSNPTQMWIGRPTETVRISYTDDVLIRLPDKYFGMFLGYAMDAYGLNPAMMIGLGAKESFSFARYGSSDDGSYFIVENDDDVYDCYSSSQRGLCRDGNLDGPFQVETGGMSSDVAVLPNRFWIGNTSIPKKDRTILYMYDNAILQSEGFREYHDYWVLNNGRAVVLSSLDFHFRHNLVMNMKKVGLIDALNRRSERIDKDSLEFATAMYTYNRGVFDTQLINMLANCDDGMDPCIDCALDGYGGHTTDIRIVCKNVDSVENENVYDFDISMENVNYFVDTLETTFPFYNVDWDTLRSEVEEAYNILKNKRSSDTISFRYDWRTLLAVIRMHLTSIEYFVGDQVKGFQNYWGDTLNDDLGPYADINSFPYSFCSSAGGRDNLCSSKSSKKKKFVHKHK
ncbi:Chitin binding lectin [Entamoeba marina]